MGRQNPLQASACGARYRCGRLAGRGCDVIQSKRCGDSRATTSRYVVRDESSKQSPNDFPGLVRKGESVRYSLEIEADNFSSAVPYVFEVSWDGEWYDDSEAMAKHLTIRQVSP